MRCSFIFSAICILALAAFPAHSAKVAESSIMQGILRKLETENRECTVGLEFSGQISNGEQNENFGFDSSLLLIYGVESCGGGNNWSANAQVIAIKDGKFRALGKVHTWSIVKGVDFNYERALIYAVDQLPGDGHCCPTGGKTVEVTLQNGQPVFKQLKTWKATN